MGGLTPVRYLSGAPYNGAVNRYYVGSGNGTALYPGSPVALGGSGDSTGKYPDVVAATLAANNAMVGVVVSVEVDGDALERAYLPASTAGYVYVADDPNLVFRVSEDGDSSTIAAADIGNLGILVAGTADTVYNRAGQVLDSSSFASSGTANGQFKLVALEDKGSQALAGTSPRPDFLVAWNKAQHSYG